VRLHFQNFLGSFLGAEVDDSEALALLELRVDLEDGAKLAKVALDVALVNELVGERAGHKDSAEFVSTRHVDHFVVDAVDSDVEHLCGDVSASADDHSSRLLRVQVGLQVLDPRSQNPKLKVESESRQWARIGSGSLP